MLKTSPVLADSANGSPASFCRSHSAMTSTARSPQMSPRPPASLATSMSAAVRSRPSLTAAAPPDSVSNAPRQPRSTLAHGATLPSECADPRQERQSSVYTSPPQGDVAAASAHWPTTTSAASALQSTDLLGQSPAAVKSASPYKRRGSPARKGDDSTSPSDASATTGGPSIAPKRPRTDERAPKLLPQRYELCAVEDIVELVAHMMAELITTNDALRASSAGLTRFHSRTAPGISVRDYLLRLAKHGSLTPPLLLAMVYYIDRLCLMYSDFTINTLTVHRFLITAATVAAKGLSDAFYNNTYYAKVGGVRVAELKLLELEFLYRVDWKIVPNPEVLVAYYRGLVERTPQYTIESEPSSASQSSSLDDDDDGDGDGDDDGDDDDDIDDERADQWGRASGQNLV